MSKYTTELRFICETSAGLTESAPFSQVNDIIETAAPVVFNFDWPIFDENYRLPLEIKILRHFYTREICEETVGLWKLRLQDRLCMIMPYYNDLYRSQLLQFNPFYDVDYTREHSGENTGAEYSKEKANTERSEIGNNESAKTYKKDVTSSNDSESASKTKKDNTSSSDSESTSKNNAKGERNTTKIGDSSGNASESDLHWDLYSDTPQGGINGIDADNDSVLNNTYLTNARKVTDSKASNYNDNTSENAHEINKDESEVNANATTIETNNENAELNESTSTLEVVTGRETETHTNENTLLGAEQNSKEGNRNITNFEEYAEHVKGKQGTLSYSKMLQEFRDTFLNIDKMIIDNLNDLFFGLW